MKPWKAILAALVIFLAGLTSGGFAALLYRVKSRPPPPPALPASSPSPWMNQRIDFLRRLSDKMDLTASQHANIDRHLDETQQRLRALWEPVEPQARQEMAGLRQRIEAELTPRQRERFAALLKARNTRPAAESPPRRHRAEPTNAPAGAPDRPVPPNTPPPGERGPPAAAPRDPR